LRVLSSFDFIKFFRKPVEEKINKGLLKKEIKNALAEKQKPNF
jgi:hypothetical protein